MDTGDQKFPSLSSKKGKPFTLSLSKGGSLSHSYFDPALRGTRTAYVNSIGLWKIVEGYVFSIMDSLVFLSGRPDLVSSKLLDPATHSLPRVHFEIENDVGILIEIKDGKVFFGIDDNSILP